MKNIKIRVCENNLGFGIEKLLESIKENHKEIEIETVPCFGICDDCCAGPYVFINNEFIQAEFVEELEVMIEEKLNS